MALRPFLPLITLTCTIKNAGKTVFPQNEKLIVCFIDFFSFVRCQNFNIAVRNFQSGIQVNNELRIENSSRSERGWDLLSALSALILVICCAGFVHVRSLYVFRRSKTQSCSLLTLLKLNNRRLY